MFTIEDMLADCLRLPDEASVYDLSRWVAHAFSGHYILETEDWDFDLSNYVKAGKCQAHLSSILHANAVTEWMRASKEAHSRPVNALSEVRWRGTRLRVLTITYGDHATRHYIIAKDESNAKAFFSAVCRYSANAEGEVLVFKGDHWHRDETLYDQIRSADLDSLVLAPGMKKRLISEFEGFFESEQEYERYGIAWKRGVLLTGPPGNGKTHVIKALVNRLRRPCLYVKSMVAQRQTLQWSMELLFDRARSVAPCILIFEDLDTLVNDRNRSYFLNEMDGFASNRGILAVGTTNYPEKLDPAISKRPSRFDRQIAFDLPGMEERQRYIEIWNEKHPEEMRMKESQIEKLAKKTEGFSFAFLKELGTSATMAWMRDPQPGTMSQVMLKIAGDLRVQLPSKPVPIGTS